MKDPAGGIPKLLVLFALVVPVVFVFCVFISVKPFSMAI